MKYNAVVIGASAGGFHAVKKLLAQLPKDFSLPVIIVQHISPSSDNYMATYLNDNCKLRVKEADEKEDILPGYVYISPPNYHLLVEEDFTLSLSTTEKVNYSRPSIDILFETAVYAYGDSLIGIVLTGANNDGAEGLRKIKNAGGYCIVQDPKEAEATVMPESAIEKAVPHNILCIDSIAKKLISLSVCP